MAGHSQFKNIMHRKGVQDAKKAKIFSKLGKEIQVAAKLGGADPSANARLGRALHNARAQNMPRERIEKAIQSGIGTGVGDDYMEMRYEGYGPGGVAIIGEALTNNKHRTAGDVRSTFSKYDGNMGSSNSVGFMFDHIGEIIYPISVASPDAVFEAALEAGASNVESGEAHHEIATTPEDLAHVHSALVAKFGEPEKSGFTWKPNVKAQVDEEQAKSVLKLIDALEDNDDIQAVITNFEVSEDVMKKLIG